MSDEDELLWSHVARTLRPFHSRGNRSVPPPPPAFDEPRYAPHVSTLQPDKQTEPDLTTDLTPGGGAKPAAAKAPPPQRHRSPPSLADFDARKARKIRAGRIEIEARLDLHGMHQSQALSALRGFLLKSQARGLKWVLVITGKGAIVRDGDAHRSQSHGFMADDWTQPQRGILRRNVPIWLSEPELRAVVVSYTSAAVHHGGDGALYVQLRTARK